MKQLLFIGFLLVPFLGEAQVVDTVRVRVEVDSLVHVCRGLVEKRMFKEAIRVIEVAEEVTSKVFGKESAEYVKCLNSKGSIYYNQDNYSEAESIWLITKSIQEKVLGKEHPEYAKSLHNLASVYSTVGEFEKAEVFFLEALSIREKTLGKSHTDYAKNLRNLGNMYMNQGDFKKAEPFFLEALSIQEKILGKDNMDYANSKNSIGALYSYMGNYEKAEPFFLESLSIRQKILGKDHPDYAQSLHNLAAFYRIMGNYARAESLFLEALSIRKKVLGEGNPGYAKTLFSLATLYSFTGKYSLSEQLYLQALTNWDKIFGKENSQYISGLTNLANLNLTLGMYEKADSLFLETKYIAAKVMGMESSLYSGCLNNLAALYFEMGNYEKAEPLHLESLAITEKTLGKAHPDFANSLFNLAILYYRKGDFIKASNFFLENNIIAKTALQNVAMYNAEEETMAFQAKYQEDFDALISFVQSYPTNTLCSNAYDNALFLNHAIFESALAREKGIVYADSSTRALYSELRSTRHNLNIWFNLPISERDSNIVDQLEEKAWLNEKELIRRSPAYAEARRQIQWNEVQNSLQPNETAIEIIHYSYYDKKITDSTMYTALILMPNDTAPRFIPLFEERQLDAIIYKPSGTRANYLQNLYSAPRADGLASLYQLIWAPIDKVLKEKDVKTVYYAPSGLLHRLNLSAIAPDKSGQTLADRYHLIPVASTRQLVTDHSIASLPTSAIIYGGVRYEMDSTAIARANKDLSATAQDTTGGLFRYAARGSERADNWDTLAGTRREALYLYNLLTKRGVDATLRMDYKATEESMKQIGQGGPSPSLLHIGTHGFFFPDPKDTTRRRANFGDDAPVFKISEHPLIRSGLKMAGSKYAWENKRPMGGMEDGILTAYEVSQMNLSNTQLVVLSACETGLGDIKGNEGVYGLQRAFRIAGAKNVLMSLWKVPDEATEKLMTKFYANWLEKKLPLREAFENAQKWLRGQKGYENPYYWAGFVLVGEL